MKNRGSFTLSKEQLAYTQQFRQSLDAHTLMERLRKPEDADDYSIQYLNNATSRGFLLDFTLIPHPFDNVLALMEIIKENCRTHGYVLYMSDSYEQQDHYVRHYLKPSYRNMMSVPINQLFGNVIVEFRFTKPNKPLQLKVTATNYPGPNYTSNTSIQEFLNMITRI